MMPANGSAASVYRITCSNADESIHPPSTAVLRTSESPPRVLTRLIQYAQLARPTTKFVRVTYQCVTVSVTVSLSNV